MKLLLTGCSHHNSRVEIRERLAFTPAQVPTALEQLRDRFPASEAVLLSTCNRVELYIGSEQAEGCPTHHDVVEFLAEFHGLAASEIFDDLFERTGEDAIRHLFTVAASLDSMVVGESQILAQVKQAYEAATLGNYTGPLMNLAFQGAIRVAKRVASETEINRRRVSIPSVAVAEFAKQMFERFDDKQVLVIGAGEMGQETLTYLAAEGVRHITIVNRSLERSQQLAAQFRGKAAPWEELHNLLVIADLVVSTTGAREPIITAAAFAEIERRRNQRPLFVLDLAVPRDFDPAIEEQGLAVYLYSVDDLRAACQRNREAREAEWPRAERIITEETARFMAELHHRSTGPTIRRLKEQAEATKHEELSRLLARLGNADPALRAEIERAFDRLVNKLLHPPLESLRTEAQAGAPHGLLDALARLFKLRE